MTRESSALVPLFVLVCLGIIYGSLYPFRFSPVDWDAVLPAFRASWRDDNGTVDRLGNVALFMPFGYLACLIAGRRSRRVSVLTLLAMAGLALALGCQLAQLAIQGRDASLADVYLNSIGIGLGLLAGQLLPLGSAARGGVPDASRHLPLALAGCWCVSLLLPLVPTLDPEAWYRAIKPLWEAPRWSWTAGFATVMSWLVCFHLLQVRGGVRLAPASLLLLALLVTGLQVVIVHNALDLTGVLSLGIAVALWWLVAARVDGRWLALLLLLAYALVALAPFGLRPFPREFGWVPFEGYLLGSMLTNAEALTRKLFIFGAVILLFVRSRQHHAAWALGAAAGLFALEQAQRHIGLGTPDVTDPLLFLLLAWLMARHGALRAAQ